MNRSHRAHLIGLAKCVKKLNNDGIYEFKKLLFEELDCLSESQFFSNILICLEKRLDTSAIKNLQNVTLNLLNTQQFNQSYKDSNISINNYNLVDLDLKLYQNDETYSNNCGAPASPTTTQSTDLMSQDVNSFRKRPRMNTIVSSNYGCSYNCGNSSSGSSSYPKRGKIISTTSQKRRRRRITCGNMNMNMNVNIDIDIKNVLSNLPSNVIDHFGKFLTKKETICLGFVNRHFYIETQKKSFLLHRNSHTNGQLKISHSLLNSIYHNNPQNMYSFQFPTNILINCSNDLIRNGYNNIIFEKSWFKNVFSSAMYFNINMSNWKIIRFIPIDKLFSKCINFDIKQFCITFDDSFTLPLFTWIKFFNDYKQYFENDCQSNLSIVRNIKTLKLANWHRKVMFHFCSVFFSFFFFAFFQIWSLCHHIIWNRSAIVDLSY